MHTNLLAQINTGVGVTAAIDEDGLIVAQSIDGNTAVYYYLEDGTQADNVSAGELSLIAIINNALLDQTNFIIV